MAEDAFRTFLRGWAVWHAYKNEAAKSSKIKLSRTIKRHRHPAVRQGYCRTFLKAQEPKIRGEGAAKSQGEMRAFACRFKRNTGEQRESKRAQRADPLESNLCQGKEPHGENANDEINIAEICTGEQHSQNLGDRGASPGRAKFHKQED